MSPQHTPQKAKDMRLSLDEFVRTVRRTTAKEFSKIPPVGAMNFQKQQYTSSNSLSGRKLHVGTIAREGRPEEEVWAVVKHHNVTFYDDSKELPVDDYKQVHFIYPFNCLHYAGATKSFPQLSCMIAYYFLAAGLMSEFIEGGKPRLSVRGFEKACVAIVKASKVKNGNASMLYQEQAEKDGLGTHERVNLSLHEIIDRSDFKRRNFDSVHKLSRAAIRALPENDQFKRMETWLHTVGVQTTEGAPDLAEKLSEKVVAYDKVKADLDKVTRERDQLQLFAASHRYNSMVQKVEELQDKLDKARLELELYKD
ncbi:hypothetical protein K491DRAFT_711311 [Lophiostoma macrostomum CBS 122681]|uniref:Uncharacterized protein n=1 Tax=Lophiostoma macrostomum CBS 122681 TaxID=1314788 RepID=A0A6A6TLV9_9PLEO|nr:hypothetical protein K491DRAFT_711311 [Lophiostoma macrostomum CBS 122681]